MQSNFSLGIWYPIILIEVKKVLESKIDEPVLKIEKIW